MATSLSLLGRPQVDHDGTQLALPAERRSQLLALLALRRGWVARAELAALFWPGHRSDLAAANVRKALHLARALPWAGALESQAGAVRFVVATDLHDVEQAMREGRVADALARCRGELLDGMDDPANPAWSDWLEGERAEHARRWHELTRARLAQLEATPLEAGAFARRLLEADPLDEDAVAALLAAQLALGKLDEQRQTYRSFAVRLDEELGVEPSQRLRRLVPQGPAPASAPGDGFYGRARELAELPALLGRDECRLLTVVGPGGVGKSSLLKRSLRQLEARFADGAFWIALDDLHDTAQVAARIAAELKLTPAPQQEPLQLICDHLAARRVLLVLDNGEHLAALPKLVERLLSGAGSVKICATSRSRLGAQGEWLLPLAGLALPAVPSAARELLACDAAQLFVSAAAAVQPGFDAAGQAAAIGALLRATGGLPLAILLAAHWVRLLPVAEIVQELEASLDVLDSGDAEGEERPEHRSMRATFEHSWQMLATREQSTLAALSVFVGMFSRQAAADVADAALPVLAALADKSLLQLLAGGRCCLHPLIRQFAGEKLAADARAEATRRHAQWFHRLLARAGPAAEAGDQRTLDDVGDELENCRQAWRWAIGAAAPEQLAASATALKQFFNVRGRVVEGLELLGEAWPVASGALASAPACAAQLASAIAQLQYRVSRLDEAAASARRGIRFARESGQRSALIRCLSVLGTCCWQWGRNEEAKRYLEQALRHALSGSDTRGAAMAQGNLALVEKALGNHARAKAMTLDWVSGQRAQGEWLRVASGLNNLAYICVAQGEWDEARACVEEGLALCDRHGLLLPRPMLLTNLANVHAATGRFDEAEAVARQVIAGARAKALADVEAAALNQLVRIAIRRGDIAAARQRLHEAAGAAAATRNEEVQLDSVFSFARILAAEGNARQAAPLLRFFLSRPQLEPVDRAEAEACLGGLPKTDPADPAAGEPKLADLLRRVVEESGAASSAADPG